MGFRDHSRIRMRSDERLFFYVASGAMTISIIWAVFFHIIPMMEVRVICRMGAELMKCKIVGDFCRHSRRLILLPIQTDSLIIFQLRALKCAETGGYSTHVGSDSCHDLCRIGIITFMGTAR